jgi:hypothetical protein
LRVTIEEFHARIPDYRLAGTPTVVWPSGTIHLNSLPLVFPSGSVESELTVGFPHDLNDRANDVAFAAPLSASPDSMTSTISECRLVSMFFRTTCGPFDLVPAVHDELPDLIG